MLKDRANNIIYKQLPADVIFKYVKFCNFPLSSVFLRRPTSLESVNAGRRQTGASAWRGASISGPGQQITHIRHHDQLFKVNFHIQYVPSTINITNKYSRSAVHLSTLSTRWKTQLVTLLVFKSPFIYENVSPVQEIDLFTCIRTMQSSSTKRHRLQLHINLFDLPKCLWGQSEYWIKSNYVLISYIHSVNCILMEFSLCHL